MAVDGRAGCLRMLRAFEFQGHICMYRPKPGIRNRKPETRNPKLGTPNPEPGTRNLGIEV